MNRLRLINSVRNVLASRYFNPEQIDKIIPNLDEEFLRQPECLAEIVDTWNRLMSNQSNFTDFRWAKNCTPALATPPTNSMMRNMDVDMTYILANVEPNLLRLNPEKLIQRHLRIKSLGISKTLGEDWVLLFNAPRGFYLQDWVELSKKIYYIEQNILDFLYDKKEQKLMTVHPLLKSAKIVECEFDKIRSRYMFALRSGYKSLSHMFSVQVASTTPGLGELLLSNTKSYLSKFAPLCSIEEYNSFSGLITNFELDEDDADVCADLAELNALNHEGRKVKFEKRLEHTIQVNDSLD